MVRSSASTRRLASSSMVRLNSTVTALSPLGRRRGGESDATIVAQLGQIIRPELSSGREFYPPYHRGIARATPGREISLLHQLTNPAFGGKMRGSGGCNAAHA